MGSEENANKSGSFGVRHVQAVMLFFALVLGFYMRINMSMAVVAMTDPTLDNSFDWNMQVQSVILSSFFWGYIILQIPGGMMAARFGGSILITTSIGVNSVVSLMLPAAANYGGWKMVCACRVIQGLSQGFIFPCAHNLIGKWVPLEEKGRVGTFIYAGGQLGTALAMICSGFLADSYGWPSIFYSTGALGMVWTIVYIFVGADSPQKSKMISDKERLYIQTSLDQIGGHKDHKTPWKSILTSCPFMSLIVAHMAQNWGTWTLKTLTPSYMSQVLNVDIKTNGVISALPYIAIYLLSFPLGILSDYSLAKKWVSVTTSRKISNTIGHYGPAIALIGLAFVPSGNVTLAVTFLIVVVGLNAGQYTGFMLVHLDMSPNFAGQMIGVTNTFANVVSIIAPLVAGVILKEQSNAEAWRNVFYLSSLVYVIGNTLFLIFGTSEKQSWNEPAEEKNVERPVAASENQTNSKR